MSDQHPTAEQAAADPNFRAGMVGIVKHAPDVSDGRDADQARPPKLTGRNR
jgi:hypothetical protein